jgi:general secretion pathway protein G
LKEEDKTMRLNVQNQRAGRERVYGAASGFTLIELLLVLVILAVLAAIVVPKFTGRTEQTRQAAAKADISSLKVALSAFELDTGRFPTAEEGLQVLVDKPADVQGWTGPYVEKVPNDPWGHPYIYRNPGSGNKDFDLFSSGPDGHEGGTDDIEP